MHKEISQLSELELRDVIRFNHGTDAAQSAWYELHERQARVRYFTQTLLPQLHAERTQA